MRSIPSSSVRAFSLIELLVVIGIMAILAAVAIPSLTGNNSALQLSGAAQRVADEINLAHQTAMTRNQPVEVRFYKFADSTQNNTKVFRGFQSFLVNDTATYSAVTKVSMLPTGITANTAGEFSTLLTDAATTTGTAAGTVTIPGQGSTAYVSFQFRSDGSLNLNSTTDSGAPWTITLEPVKGKASTTNAGLKENFAMLQIDPLIGRVKITRP